MVEGSCFALCIVLGAMKNTKYEGDLASYYRTYGLYMYLYTQIHVHDGILWEVVICGILEVLNSYWPAIIGNQ